MTLSPHKGLRVGLWGLISSYRAYGAYMKAGNAAYTYQTGAEEQATASSEHERSRFAPYPLCLCPAIYSKGANHQSNMAAPFCDFVKSQPTKMEMAILPRQT